ncbi:hypothetical protein LTS16_005743 [Friedmanniomyces endolithicus]|nr:hypothetical protein LTR59_002236 [Friedmanniomyces endolithicus]KAK0811992.1 hypothetical protein LTR38_003427 [Friedmanniomyces endolithicus]KAK0819575.1 hypothetical protein LTR75_002097 [Friedmanniomyces endolithicus]KAK0854929.1 hypothetical protein LTR03_002037 [Friedmanniomyces endolithicus]KAK0925687.1 hypothetical protein LTR57_004642 [Friedmanniomyces endolithicus]
MAAEKLDDEDEQPLVAAYLREAASHPTPESSTSAPDHTSGTTTSSSAQAATVNGDANGLHAPPPLPNGVKIEVARCSKTMRAKSQTRSSGVGLKN